MADLAVTITTLPTDNGSSITDIEYRVDGGTAVSSGGTDDFTITGLTADVEVDIEIRAVNGVGAGAWSDVKSATPTDDALWTPADLTAGLLKGWWDYSDTGNISHTGSTLNSATDKSGGGHTMTPSGSLTWNSSGGPGGEGVAAITGGHISASIAASTFPTGFTFVSVWRKTGSATTYNSGPLTRTAGATAAPFDANGPYRVIGNGTNQDVGGSNPDLGSDSRFTAWNVFTQAVPNTGVEIDYNENINGTNVVAITGSNYYGDTATSIIAASRADSATDANMMIGEQVACKELSSGDIEKIEGYLAWKWGLQSLLDAGHPYKSAAPTA